MNFETLHAMVPYEHEGELHSNTMQVYNDVRVKYPGKHAMDTDPVGGDMVVEVNCGNAGWAWKQFTHGDIFLDIESKTLSAPEFMKLIGAKQIAEVVSGEEIPRLGFKEMAVSLGLPGVRYQTLLEASQTLAVAEHRRYARYEANGGGRFLPLRFALGIIYGHWSASEAIRVQRTGVHGLRSLTKEYGNPPTVRAALSL